MNNSVIEEFKIYENMWQPLREWFGSATTKANSLPKALYYPCTLVYATRAKTHGIWTGGKCGDGCVELFTSVDNAILAFNEWYATSWYEVQKGMPWNTSSDSEIKFAVLKVDTELIDLNDWRIEELKFSNGDFFGYKLISTGYTGSIPKSVCSLEREVTMEEACDLSEV